MKTMAPLEFLEQIELGAVVLPAHAPDLVIQVGRAFYEAPKCYFTAGQAARFYELYRTGVMQLAYPGDFDTWLPEFPGVRRPLGRRTVVSAETLCQTVASPSNFDTLCN